MTWLSSMIILFTIVGLIAALLPSVYPDQLEFVRRVPNYSIIAIIVLFGFSYTANIVRRLMNWGDPWIDIVEHADRGSTVRLANLTEAQDPVTWDSFEVGQRIALVPTTLKTVKTPFQLNTVRRLRRPQQRLKSPPRFEHPITRQRFTGKNIQVVEIVK